MTTRIAALALLLAAPISVQRASGQITFAETTHTIPGPSAYPIRDIDTGDVDGDGHADILVGRNDRLYTYFGAGDGTFAAPIDGILPSFAHVYRTDAGDLDGDGCTDALVVSAAGYVLFSNCDGSFSAGPILTHNQGADIGVIADVNGDGWNDVVLSGFDFGMGTMNTYKGTGGGGFASPLAAPIPKIVTELLAVDVNADGFGDVIGSGLIYYGLPAGYVCCSFSLAPLGIAFGTAVADAYPDAQPDLVRAKQVATSPSSYSPHVYPKSSLGAFANPIASPASFSLYGDSRAMLLPADFDADGRVDLAGRTGGTSGYPVCVARGAGDGTFAIAYAAGANDQALAMAVDDFDGDGLPEIVVAHANGLLLSVLRNTTPPSPWVDLGHALAGSGGQPLLSGTGSLTAGASTALDLLHASPSSPAVLVAGGAQLALPILGGVLVPSPDVLVFGLTTTGHGTLAFAFAWPSGIPSGASVSFQAWTADAGAVQGWSASNGLAATVP